MNKVVFDLDKKTVSVQVTTSIVPEIMPRSADLGGDIQFFNDLRNGIEEILLTGGYSSVVPNEDRTVFEAS